MTRTLLFVTVLSSALVLNGQAPVAQAKTPAIVGAWVLNKDLSDQPPAPPEGGGDRERGRGRGPGGGPGGGGPGGGGFGGGGGRGGGGGFGGGGGRGGPGGGRGMDREEMERRMNAVRDVVMPAERLTITSTDSMVIVTTGDGRTTRLATDNSKIKEIGSGIERKTRWDGEKLVTEISGLGRGKATETYAIDPDTHQLIVTFDMGQDAARKDDRSGDDRGDRGGFGGPGGRGGPGGPGRMPPVPKKRVYDALPQ